MENEQFLRKRIRELAMQSYQRDIVTFSDFLNLNEQNLVHSLNFGDLGVTAESFGGYRSSERRVFAFQPQSVAYSWAYPIDCLKLTPKAVKYSEALTHRDYLGAILNLGVERAVVGDILVKEKEAYVFVLSRMTDFFLENLCRVRHTVVCPQRVDEPADLPAPSFREVSGTVASVRLDSLISLAFGASRSSMVPCIEGGQVFVNGKLVTSNGYEPKAGDIVSVRKKGRFLYDGAAGRTKKGRLGVRLLLYV